MGALVGLVSLDNLSTRIPALADFLSRHQKAKSLGSSLIPTIIVALVNMLVPTIVIQVSNRGQTFVTLSKLHHATWCRYWKWVMVNVGKSRGLATAHLMEVHAHAPHVTQSSPSVPVLPSLQVSVSRADEVL
jgi:hypothetical protein